MEKILCSLVDVTKIPVCIYQDSTISTYPSNITINPMSDSFQEHIINCGLLGQEIQLTNTNYFESFLSIPFVQHNQRHWLILGPIIYNPPKKEGVSRLLSSLNKSYLKEEFEDYLMNLAVESSNQLIEIGKIAYYLVQGVELNIRKELRLVHQQEELEIKKQQSCYITNIRENNLYHHDPLLERRIYQLIEEGNVKEIIPYHQAFRNRDDFEYGLLSRTSELRSQKNTAIATITLATRAAIRGGVHPEDAYSLGDVMIQDLEDLTSLSKVIWFREKILYDFAELVRRYKKQRYTRKITQCQEYIYKEIYEPNLSVSSIAQKLGLNPKYLSNLFKKEVGISISEYTQKIKVKEAKNMMLYFNRSVTEVCNSLHFSDQSYFIKVFKKHTKMTPREYIKKNQMDPY